MKSRIAMLFVALAAAYPLVQASTAPAVAQQAEKKVQLRLTNSMTDKVDYYLNVSGKPTYAGSIKAGAAVDVDASKGQVLLFAVNRVQFQKYTVRAEIFQSLTLAPKERQTGPKVANSYQQPLGASKAKTVKPAPDAGTDTGQAAVDDGLKWGFNTFENADEGGAMNAQLTRMVPETDNVQFLAACTAAEGSSDATIVLSADVSRFQNGADAKARFQAQGFDRSIQGKVTRSDGGEGQEGVYFAVQSDDPLWQAFQKYASLKYSVGGQAALSLPLNGVRQPLSQFLAECASYGAAASVGADDPGDGQIAATDLFGGTSAGGGEAEDSCQTMAGIKSVDTGKQLNVTFVNQTNELRVVDWIDRQGVPVQYAQLDPGQSFEVTTLSTHPWMLTDGPGNCIEMMMPKLGQATFDITRASPGFGDE